MPAWFKPSDVLWPLIDRLEVAQGRERGDLIAALATITHKDYGYNVAAWAAHARGQEPDAAVLAERIWPPSLFGIPLYGRRLVIVMDANMLTVREHPFSERARLQAICRVPGGPDIPWQGLHTIEQLVAAHVRRAIEDLPTRGQKFELIFSKLKPQSVFGKLTVANAGSKKTALAALARIEVANQNDILAVMTRALDIAGSKDSVAWSKGPDQIVCIYSSVPWLAPETDADVVGSAIGLKARRRQVQIHAVGIREFAYGMLRLFAEESGGRYLPLLK